MLGNDCYFEEVTGHQRTWPAIWRQQSACNRIAEAAENAVLAFTGDSSHQPATAAHRYHRFTRGIDGNRHSLAVVIRGLTGRPNGSSSGKPVESRNIRYDHQRCGACR